MPMLPNYILMNQNKFILTKIKILVLGAGIGTINYYFNKIIKF